MTISQQKDFIANMYRVVFKQKGLGTDAEITEKIRQKVSLFFSSNYEQWSNSTYFNYKAFLCHCQEVNTRSDAIFNISFLAHSITEMDFIQVTTRTIVLDAATQAFESVVISIWTFTQDGKMLLCKEALFSLPTETDACGMNQDPAKWEFDISI